MSAARQAYLADWDTALEHDRLRDEARRLKFRWENFGRVFERFGPVLDQEWRSAAACRGASDVMFATDTSAAAALCASCPVIDPCRAWVTADPDQLGFVAGTTESERTAAREHEATA